MENSGDIELQLEELFGKREWSEEESAWLLNQLGTNAAEIQRIYGENFIARLEQIRPVNLEQAQALLSKIHQVTGMEAEAPVIPIRRNKFRWIAAASIIILLGLGAYFIFFNSKPKELRTPELVKINDVKAPSTNRASITLADGRKIYLDSIENGTVAKEGNVQLNKVKEGQITYNVEPKTQSLQTTAYNTLTNPRGSKVIDMTLSDGSRVWLNAGSSITYPVAFIGNERKVSVNGEAYFEVTHNKLKPFIVSAGNSAEVEVLGTHFNLNAYDDEKEIKVTLLEGSVKVSELSTRQSRIIKPGQQVKVSIDHSPLTINESVDLEAVMAWRNGRFQFEGAGIEETMRQIARWYDVEVVYENKPQDQHFRGGINRNVEASKVFKMLETTGAVHFRIEGKKVFVLP